MDERIRKMAQAKKDSEEILPPKPPTEDEIKELTQNIAKRNAIGQALDETLESEEGQKALEIMRKKNEAELKEFKSRQLEGERPNMIVLDDPFEDITEEFNAEHEEYKIKVNNAIFEFTEPTFRLVDVLDKDGNPTGKKKKEYQKDYSPEKNIERMTITEYVNMIDYNPYICDILILENEGHNIRSSIIDMGYAEIFLRSLEMRQRSRMIELMENK